MAEINRNRLRALPSVAALLADQEIRASTSLSPAVLTELLQGVVEQERAAIVSGSERTRSEIRGRVLEAVMRFQRPRLAPVLNATGVVIHTNLGRAPVSPETAAAMADAASSSVALEIEPETNERGGRMREVSDLMRLLTCAEATLVVNNNAAAILLVLSALASGRSVILSRGEAVEIGGGFRIPDVLRQSGATLVEVGTTNRTYARDYLAAIDDKTAAFLKVHPSNFRLSGFTHAATIGELAELAKGRGIEVIDDQGSGAILPTAPFGLAPEPTIGDSIRSGASIVTASGDKLLGGPQAGLILGRRELVDRIAAHPLARAVRADKTCLAGMARTLRHYTDGDAIQRLPVWRMIAAPAEEIRHRAERLREQFPCPVEVVKVESTVGGGSLPGETLPSTALAVGPAVQGDGSLDDLARRLRTGEAPVFGRIVNDRLLLDLRTVLPEQDETLRTAVEAALAADPSGTLRAN